MIDSQYTCKTQINVKSSNPCPISTSQTSVPQIYVLFSMMSLTYALTLTLTNKSAIDQRIWKGHQFENTLKSDHDVSGR